MSENSIKQLINAANNNNGFAITLLGTLLINSQIETNIETGIEKIQYAADGKNVLLAKNLRFYMYKVRPCEFPIHYHALIDPDAKEQLENYVAEGDYWAMIILGDLLYQGKVIPQDRETAEVLLGRAALQGCLYAKELVDEYGLSTTRAIASEILGKFEKKNDPKYWILK